MNRFASYQGISEHSGLDRGRDWRCHLPSRKNESGKTALLQTLYRLNPFIEANGDFDVTDDYPRRAVSDYKNDVKTERREPAQIVRAHRRTALPASGYAGISGERSVPSRLLDRRWLGECGALRRSPGGDILQDAAFRVDLGETVRAARVVGLEPTDRSYLLSARHHRRVGTRDAQDGGARFPVAVHHGVAAHQQDPQYRQQYLCTGRLEGSPEPDRQSWYALGTLPPVPVG